MSNWLGLNKGDYGFLFVHYRKVPVVTKGMKDLFEKLYDQYIEQVGLTTDYLNVMLAMKRHTDALITATLEPTSINKTRLAHAKQILDDQNTGEKSTFESFVAAVEKYMGYTIDLTTISVIRFYSYVKMMKEAARGV